MLQIYLDLKSVRIRTSVLSIGTYNQSSAISNTGSIGQILTFSEPSEAAMTYVWMSAVTRQRTVRIGTVKRSGWLLISRRHSALDYAIAIRNTQLSLLGVFWWGFLPSNIVTFVMPALYLMLRYTFEAWNCVQSFSTFRPRGILSGHRTLEQSYWHEFCGRPTYVPPAHVLESKTDRYDD